eukprot:TRINITY_DN953_c0_g1_i4.p1 TRINITY_DN953_c0_g1~~TRINITY_DN953_c0_g1_i4.p1  ORF type:complete len:305 (+),score=76.55 TRINITY_DN953_c0_g1_i4:35-916(+)
MFGNKEEKDKEKEKEKEKKEKKMFSIPFMSRDKDDDPKSPASNDLNKVERKGSQPQASGEQNISFLPFIPERFIFCLDLSEESNGLEFSKTLNKKVTRLDLVKLHLRLFVQTKQRLCHLHEYAIMAITDVAIWYQDFTSNVEEVLNNINNIHTIAQFTSFNMSTLFQLLNDKVNLKQNNIRPEFVYRIVFIYSRSSCIPHYNEGCMLQKETMASPFVIYDACYLHEKASKDNKPQEIYDVVSAIENVDENSYTSETVSSCAKLNYFFCLLLAHALQRPHDLKKYSDALEATYS